jgi:hypothetical protein
MNKGRFLIRLFGIMLIGTIILGCTPPKSSEKKANETKVDKELNKIGDLTWELKDGTLTISGQGVMPNFASYYFENYNGGPWGQKISGPPLKIMSIIINEGVTNIGDNAFRNLKNVVSVSLPSTLTNIGSSAFNNCNSLISVVIPDGVVNIGGRAFENCWKLIQIEIPDSVIKIGGRAFENCGGLVDIVFGKKLQFIGIEAFNNCKTITTITSNNPIPPVFEYSNDDIFFHDECRLLVPNESINKYKNHKDWGLFFMDKEKRDIEIGRRVLERSRFRVKETLEGGGGYLDTEDNTSETSEPFLKLP